MTLYDLLRNFALDVQRAEHDMQEAGKTYFLEHFDEEGNPKGTLHGVPHTHLRHHKPIGHKRVTLDIEANARIDKTDKSILDILLHETSDTLPVSIHIEYETSVTPEGVHRVHESH